MATTAVPYAAPSIRRNAAALLPLFLKETKYEFLKLFRNRSFSLSNIGFPVMFYVLFGLGNKHVHDGPVDIAKYVLAGMACSGMVSAALYGVGVGLATERGQGWLELKRASPMPPAAYLLAKCITAQAFGVIAVAILMALGTAFAGVVLSARESVLLLCLPLLAAVPFAAMGLLIALVVPPNAASGIVNVIYMPMAILGGLWLPLSILPHWLRVLAPSLPTYHLAQVALSIFGYQNNSSVAGHIFGLLGFTLVMLGVSWAVFQRAEQNG